MAEETNVAMIEVYEGEDGQYYWRGRAANGEIVDQGEGYTRHDDAVEGAEKVHPGVEISRANSADPLPDADGEAAEGVDAQ